MFDNLWSRLKTVSQKSFVKDTAILQTGTLVSFALSFLTSIVYTRILHPLGYGQYGLVLSFVGIFGLIFNFGAGYATLTLLAEAHAKRDKKEILNIVTFFFKTALFYSGLIMLVIFILAPWLTKIIYHNNEVGFWARILLAANLFSVFFSYVLVVWQVLRKMAKLVTLENVHQLTNRLLPAALVLLGWGVAGILWGQFFTQLIFMLVAFVAYQKISQQDDLLPHWREILHNFFKIKIKKYFIFGWQIGFDNAVSTLFEYIPITLLGIWAVNNITEQTQIGLFRLAFKYIGLATFALGPISRLLQVQLPRSKIQGELKDHLSLVTKYSLFFSFALVAILVVLARYFIPWFYGPDYLPAVDYVYILSIGFAMLGLEIGVSSAFRTLNKMKEAILINSSLVILLTIIIFVLKFLNISTNATIIAFSISLIYIIRSLFIYSYVHKLIKKTQI